MQHAEILLVSIIQHCKPLTMDTGFFFIQLLPKIINGTYSFVLLLNDKWWWCLLHVCSFKVPILQSWFYLLFQGLPVYLCWCSETFYGMDWLVVLAEQNKEVISSTCHLPKVLLIRISSHLPNKVLKLCCCIPMGFFVAATASSLCCIHLAPS